MLYTVTATLPSGTIDQTHLNNRANADDLYGVYLNKYPEAEVRLTQGNAVLVSAGPRRRAT